MDLRHDIIDRNNDIISYVKDYCRKKNKRIDSLKISSLIAIPTYIVFKVVPEFNRIFSVETLVFVLVVYSIAFLLIYLVKNDNFLSIKSGEEIFKLSKAVLVNILVKSIDNRINYYPTRKILNSPIKESNLFKSKITEVKGSDLFSLDIGYCRIEFSFVKLFAGIRPVFSGMFIHIENINTNLVKENLYCIKQKNKWSTNQNDAFIAIPLKLRNPLVIELNGKENKIDQILEQISIIFEIFSFFEAITKVRFEPISDIEKEELLEKHIINLRVEPQKLAYGITRMINFMIDSVAIVIIASVFYLICMVILSLFTVKSLNEILVIGFYLVIYFAYYIYFETKYGKTLGKIITKTKVVNQTFEKPSFKLVIIRTLTRLIPFDVYSFLDNDVGWHDKLSKTRVIYRNEKLPNDTVSNI